MYFVNRSEIEAILKNMDELLNEVKEQNTFSTPLDQLGLERLVHVLIESILDVGNMMIDGFIMRDPGSYHDIIDILIDEKVLPKSEEDRKSTRLNSSHVAISYAVFCLKKKK